MVVENMGKEERKIAQGAVWENSQTMWINKYKCKDCN
jgi:hypothetical protein